MSTTGGSTGMSVGLMWRGDPAAPLPVPSETRFRRVFEEFAARGVAAEPVVYDDVIVEQVQARLLQLDAVLVWIDPIVRGQDRSILDALLREAAAAGVFVSAHPDVILSMGTKDVLYRTRDLPWGMETHRYTTLDELRGRMPDVLRASGVRVLKQDRGSGGNGVWKVELVRDAEPATDAVVRVQAGERGAQVEEMRFGDFVEQRRDYFRYFGGRGLFIDQPYAGRLGDGMIRCYQVHDRVAGFGHQRVTALLPPPPGTTGPPDPEPRVYFGPDQSEFQPLKRLLESGWIAEMQRVLRIERAELPIIWDADFLLGPRTPSGEDTYLLCEINVSGVFPIPEESIPPLVDATLERIRASRAHRAGR